jgi:hypothetical protein
MSNLPPQAPPVAVPPTITPATPAALGYATPGASGAQLAVWTDGRFVYARDGSLFPPMCIKCGTDAYVKMRKKRFTWFHPLAYLGLLGGILPFAIVALIMQKKATVSFGVCSTHRTNRLILALVGTFLVLGSIALMVVAGMQESGLLFLAALAILLISIIGLAITSPIMTPARIEDGVIKLKRVSPEFMKLLSRTP